MVGRLLSQNTRLPQSPSQAGQRERVPVSRLRGLESVGVFSGRPGQFENWRQKLEDCLGDEPGLRERLHWAERQQEAVTDELLETDHSDELLLSAKVYSNNCTQPLHR